MNQLIPRPNVEEIVRLRDKALEQYETAFGKIAEADAALREARAIWQAAAPTKAGTSNYYSGRAEEVDEFHKAVRMPDRDRYLRTARRLIDISVWEHIIEATALESLMDSEAKETLRKQMQYVPERTGRHGEIINQEEIDKGLPPVTVENVVATLEAFQADSVMIFQRGIANAFSKLDRRFRSHDGFKIGSRVILDYLFYTDTSTSLSPRKRDALIDIERTFLILDEKDPRAPYAGIVGDIERNAKRSWSHGNQQTEHEGDYFRVRVFKNGNAHLWFTRKDLVEKVNKILAAYYGEVIADGQTKDEDPLNKPKTTPARYYGFFPTPPQATDILMGKVRLLRSKTETPLRILEPSAGTGNLARRCIAKPSDLDGWSGGRARYEHEYRFDNKVDCIEIQPHLAHALEAEGIYNKVTCADFLEVRPDPANLYDYVVMNPPFDRERDIDHVVHALKFLKPTGQLVAIMSAGTEFRETKKCQAFRELVERMHGRFDDLPAGSFSSVGTNVNTIILHLRADGRDLGRY
jgi:hypothetical protein